VWIALGGPRQVRFGDPGCVLVGPGCVSVALKCVSVGPGCVSVAPGVFRSVPPAKCVFGGPQPAKCQVRLPPRGRGERGTASQPSIPIAACKQVCFGGPPLVPSPPPAPPLPPTQPQLRRQRLARPSYTPDTPPLCASSSVAGVRCGLCLPCKQRWPGVVSRTAARSPPAAATRTTPPFTSPQPP
jgi:hypothetical protein